MGLSLDIVQLRTFIAIEECGGFGRAAVALHMSQPTVSQHVRQLEKQLGQQLVRRDGRRTKFTPDGERLLMEARRILAVHDEALSHLDIARMRTILVGSTETAAEPVLPELITTLRGAFPERHVQFRVDRSTAMTEAVAKGEIDLAVVLDTGNDLPGTEVGSLPLNWFAAPGWQPPERDAPLPLVAYLEPCGMRQRALHELNERGRRVEIAAEAATLDGVIAAARAGLGLAVLPSFDRGPGGLVRRGEFPDLGRIAVRIITRKGLEPTIEEAATDALEHFFRVKQYIRAVVPA